MRSIVAIIFGGILLAGCSMSPKLKVEPIALPLASASSYVIDKEWWRGFGDPVLEELISEALKHNSDLLKAASNISLARATLGGSSAERYPRLGIESSAMRRESSKESFPKGSGGVAYNNFSLSGVLSFELDLWGRLRDTKRANEALLHANEAIFETIRLALASGVAESYFGLLTLREQCQILRESVDSYQKSYDYRLKQFSVGAISEIVLEQSHVQLESAKASLYAYERQESEAKTALSILLGRTPKEIVESDFTLSEVIPNIPEVPEGIPSDLLERRADIKSAYERLKATNYSIGVARSRYFPTISLSSAFGYQSAELSSLVSRPAQTWSVGGNLAAPLVDFGRTGARVDSAKAQKESAEIDYIATIRRAFGEVKDALNRREVAHKRLSALSAQAKAQARVLQIAEKRFDSGYSSHLELLDAQRHDLSVKLSLSAVKLENLAAIITLYKALGGGWSDEHAEE